jgi:hypothetical protein
MNPVHTEIDELSIETKIDKIKKEIDDAARETNAAALDDKAYRAAAQKELKLRTALRNLLMKRNSIILKPPSRGKLPVEFFNVGPD